MTDAANPLLAHLGHALRAAALRAIDDAHFGSGARHRAGGGAGQYHGHRGQSRGADIRQHDRGAGTGGRHARPGGGCVLQPRGIGLQPRAGGIAAGVRAEVLCLFLRDHQQREALRAHRGAVGAARGAGPDRGADARALPDASQLRAVGRGAGRRGARAADRGQEPTGGAGHVLHPEPLADEREWFMELAEADLEGLPDFVVAAARAAGRKRARAGRW
jgi:hypothetical protein